MPRPPASTPDRRRPGAPVKFTVSPTPIPTWYGHGRRSVLVASGKLTSREWPHLSRLTATTVDTGVDRVVLDVWAVVSCDREALLALSAVRGRWPTRPSCVVDVVGVRRAQFAEALAREPVAGVHALEAVIDELRRPQVLPLLPTGLRPGGDPGERTGTNGVPASPDASGRSRRPVSRLR